MNCEYCGKEFSSKSNLSAHIKTAKYCLEIRGQTEKKLFECEFCSKVLSQKATLIDHLETCKERYKKMVENTETKIKKLENEIGNAKRSKLNSKFEELLSEKLAEKDKYYQEKLDEKDEYICKLEAKITKFEDALIIANKKSTTTNVVINNNSLDLSKERVRNVIETQLTPLIVGKGQEGLALLCATHLLKNEKGDLVYKCTDPSRQIFEYVDNDGCVVKDVKAVKLTSALSQSGNLEKKARESAEKLWTDENGSVDNDKFNFHVNKVMDISNLSNDNTRFRSTLTSLTS
jgi:hypothetical protein